MLLVRGPHFEHDGIRYLGKMNGRKITKVVLEGILKGWGLCILHR